MKQICSEREPLFQSVADAAEFVRGQIAQLAFELGQRDRLHLLDMKRSCIQKRLGDGNLPAITPERACVCDDGNEGQFVIGGVGGQHETWTGLCCHAEINEPNFTGTESGHLLPVYPTPERQLLPLPWRTEAPRVRLPTQAIAVKWRGVRRASAWAARRGFQSCSRRNVIRRSARFNSELWNSFFREHVAHMLAFSRCASHIGEGVSVRSSKIQAPRYGEAPSTKHQMTRRFGAWMLGLLWILDLGAWSFSR
jgi:hypothetical protein